MDETATRQIERSIEIDARAEAVWKIISEPGWWVNRGTLTGHRIEVTDDGTQIVHDPDLGAFRVATVALEEPRYAAFRWHPTDPDDPSTLAEFWITDRPAGGVSLRVVESGFEQLPSAKLHAFLRDNTHGWEVELTAAKSTVEAG